MEALMTRFALGSALFLSLVGCGSVESTDKDPGDPGDTTAPSIVKVTPANGDKGVPADAAIVIQFSEAMNQESVEALYTSMHLDKDTVTMSWNEAGDTLTITPKQKLDIAEGIGFDPSTTEAKEYRLAISEDAVDLAGNELAGRLDLAFTTQKRMAAAVSVDQDMTRYRSSSGGVSAVGADLRIGDNAALQYRGFVTFSLLALPDGVEIETATLGVRQVGVTGTPFDLGVVNAAHITYLGVNSTAWNEPALGAMGALTTTTALGPRSLDVSPAVADDYAQRAARSGHSQFRLEFPTANNGDGDGDYVELQTSTFELSLTYLAP
jgi:hypothetical protein